MVGCVWDCLGCAWGVLGDTSNTPHTLLRAWRRSKGIKGPNDPVLHGKTALEDRSFHTDISRARRREASRRETLHGVEHLSDGTAYIKDRSPSSGKS